MQNLPHKRRLKIPITPLPSPTIDACLGVGMVGGVKAVILLLALVLIAGGAASSSTTDKHPEHVPYQHSHDSHPSHHQAPPLLEMLPPIGPVGFVLLGVVADQPHVVDQPRNPSGEPTRQSRPGANVRVSPVIPRSFKSFRSEGVDQNGS